MTIEERRKMDRENKRQQRQMNTAYAQRVRASKRSDKAKARRQELRARPETREQEREYVRQYRKRPEVAEKNRARGKLNHAIATGRIVRASNCFRCGSPDIPLKDGRSGLRADHYEGYAQPFTVRFVCPKCDGDQERERGNTTLGKVIAVA